MSSSVKTFFVGFLFTWATIWFLYIPIALLFAIRTIYKLWKLGDRRLSVAFVVLSPFLILPIFNVSKAVIDYSTGEASIRSLGYPSNIHDNLDPELRLRYVSKGSPTLTEYLTHLPYNAMVRWLIDKKGYQVNSYTGYLPTSTQADSLLTSDLVQRGNARLKEDSIMLDLKSSAIIISLSEQEGLFQFSLKQSKLLEEVKYVVYENCLVIQLNNNWIYIIDTERRMILSHFEKGDSAK